MQRALRERISTALGAAIRDVESVAGGDINDAYRVRLADGRAVFVKTNDAAPPDMFAREAEGLSWLAEAGALATPEVLAASSEGDEHAFLALEWIDRGAPSRAGDERFGRGLARLHRYGAPCFGGPRDNYIGSLPQENTPEDDWPSFYARRRLEPMLRSARERGRATAAMSRGMDRLFARLPALVGPSEPPSRLHGDLWGGNRYVAADGSQVLIDPAAYGGHREIDLAMMKLFGGFSDRVFAAYAEEWPLAPGFEERVPLYQLYPMLVHVNLFGGAYARSVERLLDAIG